MRVVALNGSYRGKRGYTQFLLDKVLEGTRAAGAEAETVLLARKKIERCLGCGRCQTEAHHLRCVHHDRDEVAAIFEQMARADLVIYATPIYVFTLSSLLKALLERFHGICDSSDLCLSGSGLLFHQVDRAVCAKPFATLVCCDNLEEETTRNALAYFRTFARFLDAPYRGSLVRSGGRIAGHGKVPAKLEELPRLRDVYEAFVEAGRDLATRGAIRRSVERRAAAPFLPAPAFRLMMRIPFAKRQIVARARAMQAASEEEPGE